MPRYETEDPKGWCGDPSRGAALGRRNWFGAYDGQPLTLQRVRINQGGYDRLGTYWGIGAPLYWCASQDGETEFCFRAADRAAAKDYVRGKVPGARFYR